MSKEFDEFIADNPGLNLISKEEVSLLKIKLGKSHRKESDWEEIKEIFRKRDVLTFTPDKWVKGVGNIEKILCHDGFLVVFSNIDDCMRHIREMQHRREVARYVPIGSISFMEVVEIAERHNLDVLIDVNEARNSKCFLYDNKRRELKVVIMAQP